MNGFGAAVAMLALATALIATGYLLHGAAMPTGRAVIVSPFESGMRPTVHAVSRFHVRWYLVTLLFLAFDVEMLFMYPWAVVVRDAGATAVVEMFIFLGALMAGVVYAWREGALRWA
ncbi:NADH-quinone oxidoreductase subunit A [Solicola gregarius]|uniref:NADH-quinone oxidoreductase subunit n=1 Tax=Solicola gregarius TaxID=2908642 RepID=A0AA46YLK1_9ACTN|nr:NADH-quinone oxidoreductase subunit A [Solicola gregarius]UYM05669.1 NADH-quinone oxidoreductase subunit A [Solicola gregarius]